MAFAGSAVRDARVFHPEGELYRAEVEAADGFIGGLGQRMAGPALVRLSAALWKDQRERPDILGAAIRFGWDPMLPLAVDGVQDLLLITSSRFWSIPASLLTTHVGDYLHNTYYSIVSFRTDGIETEFRLIPRRGGQHIGPTRAARLADAAAKNEAIFTLQSRPAHRLPVSRRSRTWQPVATIRLVEKTCVNEKELLFTPFHAGRGIQPTGLANQVRRLTYPGSKLGRSGTS